MFKVILKPGREESLLRRHPWVFSGALDRVEGGIQSGETAAVHASDGRWLAWGAWSPQSQIRLRLWSFNQNDEINIDFLHRKIENAKKARDDQHLHTVTSAYRVINAESDGLPGLIVDRYGDFLVCQFLATGAEHWKKEIVSCLEALFPGNGIYERSDADVRNKEGLRSASGLLAGEMPPRLVEIHEDDIRYYVDIIHGHKTGFYLDQRDNRAIISVYSSHAHVLNCFSYTGGFGLRALKSGASSVTNIDSSEEALNMAKQNAVLNGMDAEAMENVTGDAFQVLRYFRDGARQFDVVVLDPPKFVTSLHQMKGGTRGYKDINLIGIKLLRPGGILFTFSCSGLVNEALFQKIVADAALDAGRDVQIIRYLSQAADHPIALNFPESRYLKGMVCSVW
jgi:23S rRNA (cytosine1962-C5)-methyltransferase